jgi:[ribosomal protein S5]-alanine N-acetyltransferase
MAGFPRARAPDLFGGWLAGAKSRLHAGWRVIFQHVTISTTRLLLRAPALSDAPRISLLAGDYTVGSMTGTIPHPYSEEMACEWIGGVLAGEEGVVFAIEHAGALIGCAGYRAHDKTHAELGYWIGKPFWGRGYATEAARAVVAYAFQSEYFDYLTVGHFEDNAASARVIAKLGFVASGGATRDCAARGKQARCLTYRLDRDRALA